MVLRAIRRRIASIRHSRAAKPKKEKLSIGEWINTRWFNWIHGNNLVYNTCWEDPRLDRVALEIKPTDTVMVITSAGCNALDYVLAGAKHVHAVDMNPRQNALLELKQAGIRKLGFDDFFLLFGKGRTDRWLAMYQDLLRAELSPISQRFWDRHTHYFTGKGWRRSFFFHGTTGVLARLVNHYIDRIAKIRGPINDILAAETIEEQQRIYYDHLKKSFWTRFTRWAMNRDTTLSLVGVPGPQRKQVELHYNGKINRFVEDAIEAVFAKLPIKDNYFWRVYLNGEYSRDCCPEYLVKENFEKLKGGLVDRVTTYTGSVLDFLTHFDGKISRYVLLDHMDWLSTFRLPILELEWQSIVDRAADQTRIIWRSGGMTVDFVDPIRVATDGGRTRVGDLLRYHHELASRLHEKDRVHTYGSFYIADLVKA